MSTDEKPSDYYDRYSRQHYVLGDKAMNKMAKAQVLISGMGGVGVEIAKNVTLAGVRKITIHDSKKVSHLDLSTQYYLSDSQIGQCRATLSHSKLKELNPYVKCVVLTDAPLALAKAVNDYCHAREIAFLLAEVRGAFGWAFSDAGSKHEVFDATGEPIKEALIEKVELGATTKICCFDNNLHDLQDGDFVQFVEMGGISELNYETNNVIHKVLSVLTPTTFTIGTDSTNYKPHTHGGKVMRVNVPKEIAYKPLKEAMENPEFVLTDFAKFDYPPICHVAMQALEKYRDVHGDLPEPWNKEQGEEVVRLAVEINNAWSQKTELREDIVRQLAFTARGGIIGLTAFLGGMTAQEVIKVLSGKYSPLNQWLYVDAVELLPKLDDMNVADYMPKGDRYDGQRILIGSETVNKLLDIKLFMIGAGAIGCEMMKNFAMLGTGAGEHGKITLTDNDLIEKSNLNRQFLFRDSDLQKPKSATAAAAAKVMNPGLMVEAFLDKVCPESESKYSDAFFQSLDIVVNALDNVQARIYVDGRCTTNQRPLLESGTLGTKGHVQVILPHLTETYSNQSDPQDESFPVCTIKSFPGAIEHTIQWARSKFQSLFSDKPNELVKFFEDRKAYIESVKSSSGPKLNRLRHMVKILSNRPTKFEECLTFGRLKFNSYYRNIILNLLNAFPLDMVMKDGTPFWKSPKRPPMALDFDPEDVNHYNFVLNTALLYAAIFKVDTNGMEKDTAAVKKYLTTVEVPAFVPKNKKIETDPNVKNTEPEPVDENELEAWASKLAAVSENLGDFPLAPQDFEKDDDSNHHIDFVTACSNLRALNYTIPVVDRLETKRIAGKIIPAIATTTAAVAGLVSIELVKIVQKKPLDAFKSCFLNLALPSFQLSEPGAVAKTYITKETYFTIWDKWQLNKGDMTLEEFCAYFQQTYKLQVTGVFQDVSMIYLQVMPIHKPRLKKKLGSFIKGIPDDQNYVDLIVSFANDEGKDVNGPLVRYFFK